MRPPRVSLITCPRHGRVISFFSLSISLFHLSLFERLHYAREPNASETLEKKRKRERFDGILFLFLSRERKRNRIDVMIDPGGGSIEGEGNSSEREEWRCGKRASPGVKTRFNPYRTTPRGEKTNEPEVRTWPINTEGDTLFDQGSTVARNTIPPLSLSLSLYSKLIFNRLYPIK